MTRERYNAILRAAETLFADKGYARVSTEEIANAAGVSKGLVYHHFRSKQQLLKAILDAGTVPVAKRLRSALRSNETVESKLRAIVEIFIDTACSQSEMVRIVNFEALSTEDTKGPLLDIRQANRDMFARLVKNGIAKGEFRYVDEARAAIFLAGIVEQTVLEICLQHLTGQRDTIVDDVVSMILRGIGR